MSLLHQEVREMKPRNTLAVSELESSAYSFIFPADLNLQTQNCTDKAKLMCTAVIYVFSLQKIFPMYPVPISLSIPYGNQEE